MSLTIKESFRVNAPPDRVWRFLLDPARVAQCLPGAELTETIDERTYAGRVKVKVGPISTSYAGRVQLVESDDTARRVRLVGEGKEPTGGGTARLSLVGAVVGLPDNASEVSVDATIDIAGRVMQVGRGLVESVSRQLFREFAESIRRTLEAPSTRTQELRVVPLLYRTLIAWIRRLFTRRT